jgi:DNA-binding NtrC family response regulator
MIHLLVHSHDTNLPFALNPVRGAGFSVFLDRRMDSVREIVSQGRCDVLILDLDSALYPLPQQMTFLEEIRDFGIPLVAVLGDNGHATAMDLVHRGIYNYVRKPVVIPELESVIRRAHEVALLQRELEPTRQPGRASAGNLMAGSSRQLQAVYDLIRRVDGLDVSVLITGESGTGKELIARSIHNSGDRKDHPFVAISCGAIPETLIEAELFGAEKGAFTGAGTRRKGYLEEAGKGTVLFDEIGELSAHTQVRLLRVLQEREFTRLGSTRPIPLEARLLFATHRNLAEMVEEGSFRQDLYYRINVMGITAPALRDRPEDIPELAQHFLREYSRICGKPVARISADAISLLQEHDWPGNIRELENVIQSAIIMCDDCVIKPKNLPQAMRQPDVACPSDLLSSDSFEERIQDYKVRLAQRAIRDCNGNKTHAARTLQISRTYLHRLIKDPLESPGLLSSAASN